MQIIEKCTHGNGKIGGCKECMKIYRQRSVVTNRAKYLWQAARQRARKRGVPFTIKPEDIIIPTHCPVLGIPLDSRNRNYAPSVDEVVIGLGYVPRNVAVISGKANRIKSDATVEELQAVLHYAKLRGKYARHGIPGSW